MFIGSHDSRLQRIFLSAIFSLVHFFFSRSTCLILVLERLLYDPANENPMFLIIILLSVHILMSSLRSLPPRRIAFAYATKA